MKKTIEIEVSGDFSLPLSGFAGIEGKPVALSLDGLTVVGLFASVGSTDARRQSGASEVKLRLAATSAAIVEQQTSGTTANVDAVGSPPSLTLPPSLSLVVDAPASFALDVDGADSVEIVGDLPPGLSWNQSTRSIDGTPTSEGTWSISINETNTSGTASGTLPVVVATE